MGLRTAEVFSDGMVLQQGVPIRIFGTLDRTEKVILCLNETVVETIARAGKWMVVLPPQNATGPITMCVCAGEEKIIYKDIYIGEVWFAGGQSNMEFELRNCSSGTEALEREKDELFRYFPVERKGYFEEGYEDRTGTIRWQKETEEGFGLWSAVGYYFGKRIREELGVAVGIIGCNYGGTSAACWMSEMYLLQDLELKEYLSDYQRATEGKSEKEYLAELATYRDYEARWNKIVDQLYRENPEIIWSEVQRIAGPCLWPEPLGPRSPFRPCGLYDTMLKKVAPYTIRGFLYYQGESDDHRPTSYGKLLKQLIEQWRREWKDLSLPFLFVQLPMYLGREDQDRGNWAILREQQRSVCETVKNTAMAVILEAGEFDNIHPKNKMVVGERLALQALEKVYQKSIISEGPCFHYAIRTEDKVRLYFHSWGGKLFFREDKNFQQSRERYAYEGPGDVISENGFEIAGEDQVYQKANITVKEEVIIVWSEKVKTPRYLRYAYHNFSPVTVFGENNIPLSTFHIEIE